MEDRGRYWAWLAAHSSAEHGKALLERYGNAAEVFTAVKDRDLALRSMLTPKALIRLEKHDSLSPEDCSRLFATVPGMKMLRCVDKAYPRQLLQCHDAPIVLYQRGYLDWNAAPACAVIGTRSPTREGIDQAGALGEALGRSGVITVSGMARGIDSAAHEGALLAEGPTAAVLGCGLDCVYPPESEELFYRIEKTGVLLSEYLPGMRPITTNFLPRNRIIAGLSQATVVVEAGEKSGTLHTVRKSLEYGRSVFAIPGNPEREASRGANRLIEEGQATALNGTKQLFDAMHWSWKSEIRREKAPPPALSRDRLAIVRMLQTGEKSFDFIAAEGKFSVPILNSLLTSMAMEGIIVQSPGNLFALSK